MSLFLDALFLLALGLTCGMVGFALSRPIGYVIDAGVRGWQRWRARRRIRVVIPARPLVTIRLHRKGAR
jgi:hypothetical protein